VAERGERERRARFLPRLHRYPSEILLRIPIDNWRAYEGAVSADPIPVKAAITGVTYFIGDWIAQVRNICLSIDR